MKVSIAVKRDPRVPGEPGLHVRVLVRGVVVADHMQFAAGIRGGDLLQEPQEFLVPVPWVAGVGDIAGSGLQRGGAVPDR